MADSRDYSRESVVQGTLNRPKAVNKVVKYRPLDVTDVSELLDARVPLVRSNKPLTKASQPSFLEQKESDRRLQEKGQRREAALIASERMASAALAERKLLKAQLEYDREKKNAQETVYKIVREEVWKHKNKSSPFLEDLTVGPRKKKRRSRPSPNSRDDASQAASAF